MFVGPLSSFPVLLVSSSAMYFLGLDLSESTHSTYFSSNWDFNKGYRRELEKILDSKRKSVLK